MHLIYLDEVKHHPPDQSFYWLCGFAVDGAAIKHLDAQCAAASKWYFGSEDMTAETEFHAKHIVGGSGPYKKHDMGKRVELYFKLIDALCDHDGVLKIEVKVDPSKIVTQKDPAQVALMFFIEKADQLMAHHQSLGVLIADDESRKVSSENIASWIRYKRLGTDWDFSQKINNLVDTVHHTSSHHSRMLQLADVLVYTTQLREQSELRYPKSKICEYAAEKGLFNSAKYKHWPTEQSVWLR